MQVESPVVRQLRSVLQEVDANLQRVENLCPNKNRKAKKIAWNVSRFRHKVQKWYRDLEKNNVRSASSSMESSPAASAALHTQNAPEILPILSPVNSSPSNDSPTAADVTLEDQNHLVRNLLEDKYANEIKTPKRTQNDSKRSLDSDGLPPTPKISATPSTCDVLKYHKRILGDRENTPSEEEFFQFPALTPAGLKASQRLSNDSGFKSPSMSPGTPYLDSTPTTTIQLSPSHFLMDEENHKPVHDSSLDSGDIEDKLMKSLYIGTLSCQKQRKSAKAKPKAFDIKLFPKLFQTGEGAKELKDVYECMKKKETMWMNEIDRVIPQFEMERVNLLLEMLASRGFVSFINNQGGNGGYWTVCSK